MNFKSWLDEVNMINCFNQRRCFFEKYGSINGSLLIAYWMIAGYLDPVESIEEGYEKGFNILMEFKRKGILSETFNKVLSASTSSDLNNHCGHKGHCTASNLGFDNLLDLQQLAKLMLTDGVLKDETGSVLLLDGSQVLESAVTSLKRLKYIACFHSQPDSVKATLENVDNPSLLLIRDCVKPYPNIDYSFEKLASLTVLEISSASDPGINIPELTPLPSFNLDKRIPKLDELQCLNLSGIIPELTQLQCLNLSGINTVELPEDFFSKLKQLRWLFLKKCPKLKTLPSLNNLINLEVLDLSFSLKLGRFAIRTVSSPKLQILECSSTAMTSIPQLQTTQLTHLLMRFSELRTFTPIKHPRSVQLLDLFYASQLQQVDLSQFDDLQVLDLSFTQISSIDAVEDKIHLRKLILQCCKGLEKLPALDKLESLEVLDVSRCEQLVHLPDLSNQTKLEVLDLSATHLNRLPSFSNPSRLRKVSLRYLKLDSLETLSSLSGLVELDLFNVKIRSSGEFKVDFLESLENLQTLDLSHTCVVDLPALANHKRLKELFLAGCKCLNTLPDVNILKNLEKMELATGGHYKSFKKLVLINGCDAKIDSNVSHSLHPNLSFQQYMNELFVLILDIEQDLATPTSCNDNTCKRQKLEKVKMDLEYIRNHNILANSPNLNKACELLKHFKDVSRYISKSLKLEKLVQTVARLKLLLPRTQNHESENLEPVKKKKEPKFFTTRDETNAADDIIKELVNPEATQVQTESLFSSYESLTSNEKHCLLCFSIFPLAAYEGKYKWVLCGKSIEINKKLLIHWWLGEGFIHPHPLATQVSEHVTLVDGGKSKKTTGAEILKVLTEKGFVEPVTKKGWETRRYCMHPFVHAFVTDQAKRDGFFDFSSKNGKLTPIFKSSKRACLLRSQNGTPSSCQIWAEFTKLSGRLQCFKTVKTLFNVNESVINIQPDWFSAMKDLSVLHLGNWHYGNSEHIEIGEKLFLEELKWMKQLKFFSLHGVSTVTKLPDSVCNLTNLIILDLKECHDLEELPAEIGSLQNLTYLDISNCHFLAKLPKGVMLLSKLEVLKGFVIYDRRDRPQVKKGNILRHLLNRAKENLFHEILRWEKNEVCTFRDLLRLENLRVLSIVVNRENFPNREELKVFKHMENLRKLTISWKRNFVEEDDNCFGTAQNGTNIEDTKAPQESPATSRGDSHCSSEAESENLSIKGVGAEADGIIHEALTTKKPRREHLDQIEKLKLWGLPYETAPDWLVPNELMNLQKLYIRGGKLEKLAGGTNGNEWKVTTLSLKYLPNLELISSAELRSIFPNLTDFEQYQCSTRFSFSTGSPH